MTLVPRPLIVAGLMSGTSADGIDVAFVRIAPAQAQNVEPSSKALTTRPEQPVEVNAGSEHAASSNTLTKASQTIENKHVSPVLTLALLHHQPFPFPANLRQAILAAQDAQHTSTATLARLNWRLGLAYAEAYRAALAAHPAEIDLVGCHGQTVYHQAEPREYLGAAFPCTWQIGEMALLAREAQVPVYSNFRPADLAAGGQGAPLVPLLDQTLYRHPTRTRILQNIGGIGNLTVVPPLRSPAELTAFDTGPGNMVIDTLTQQLFRRPFDEDGAIAAQGRPIDALVLAMQMHPFFAQAPPRSAGREQFGALFAADLLRRSERYTEAPADVIATATALTASSIAQALTRFVLPSHPASEIDLIVSGGGANNPTLMRRIRDELAPYPIRVLTSDDPSLPTPLPVEAKEAAAFALLAYMSHHRLPGNIPSATGARAAVILGQVTCA